MGGMTMAEIDETIITNAFSPLPAYWKCPHCGAISRLDEEAVEILIRHFKVIRHCGRCGHLHIWIFRLTEDFKEKVVEYLLNDGTVNDIRRADDD
jgi:hypothetical protein